MTEPLDQEFYAAGFTGEARKYPLSANAVTWLARWNGIARDKMPWAWCYAPNPGMQEWLFLLGELFVLDEELSLKIPLMTKEEIRIHLSRQELKEGVSKAMEAAKKVGVEMHPRVKALKGKT